MKAAIKMMTLDNSDASRTLKQHAFIPKVYKDRFTGDEYVGNISMCRKAWASDDGERPSKFVELDDEPTNYERACKKCLSKLKALGAYESAPIAMPPL